MSDVHDLTSSLNLVICDESSVNAEMSSFRVRNVGWASEIIDDWNDARPRHSAVESHSSTLQSADNSSRLLQSCLFCMCISILFLSFMLCLRVDCMNVTQTSDFAMHHLSELTVVVLDSRDLSLGLENSFSKCWAWSFGCFLVIELVIINEDKHL